MKYSPSRWADSKSVGERGLSGLTRVITTVSRQARPEIVAHVQPHAHATAKLARHFAAYLHHGRSHRSTLKEIEIGAHMHDIGKYFIASSILLKPGALDEEERAMVDGVGRRDREAVGARRLLPLDARLGGRGAARAVAVEGLKVVQ